MLLKGHRKSPTATEKWVNIFPFLDKENWQSIYKRTFEITKEPYMQSFQFKILNRIINNTKNLHKWKIKESNKCYVCGEIDGVEHHIFYCEESFIFWRRLKDWMISNLEYGFELTVCEILFGIPMNNNYDDSRHLIFLILFGKWYINKRKSNQNPIYFLEYLTLIKDKVRTILSIDLVWRAWG